MEPFISHTGRAVPLRRSNVDTDQIIPAVFLKRVSRDGFGDIFRNNATKTGLLPVRLPEDVVAALQDAAEADPAAEITVDLDGREVRCPAAPTPHPPPRPSPRPLHGGGTGLAAPFEIDDYTRWRLMEGLDDIGLTLRHADEIAGFERHRPSWLPVTA